MHDAMLSSRYLEEIRHFPILKLKRNTPWQQAGAGVGTRAPHISC